jgi:hypothetical protein
VEADAGVPVAPAGGVVDRSVGAGGGGYRVGGHLSDGFGADLGGERGADWNLGASSA